MAGIAALLVVLLAVPAAYAADYIVGDSSGWSTGVDYNEWAAGKAFTVGDKLVFGYTSMHSLSEVTKSDYESCTATASIQNYADGNTTIPLTTPGTHYFLCPASSHCGAGMKLAVTVSPAAATGAAPTIDSPGNAPILPITPVSDPATNPVVDDTPATTTTTTTSPDVKRPFSIPVGGAAGGMQMQQASGLALLIVLGLLLIMV